MTVRALQLAALAAAGVCLLGLQLPRADGQACPANADGTPNCPAYATAASVSAISGSITHAGRTTTPTTLSYPAVAVSGTVATMTAKDSKSGAAQVGDECEVASATATALPGTMRFTCAITAAGVASITAFPTLGVALAAQSVSVNVFWRG